MTTSRLSTPVALLQDLHDVMPAQPGSFAR